jgi:hypothetical protein
MEQLVLQANAESILDRKEYWEIKNLELGDL